MPVVYCSMYTCNTQWLAHHGLQPEPPHTQLETALGLLRSCDTTDDCSAELSCPPSSAPACRAGRVAAMERKCVCLAKGIIVAPASQRDKWAAEDAAASTRGADAGVRAEETAGA